MATGAAADETATADLPPERSTNGRAASDRVAAIVFGTLVVAAGPLIAYLNREQWFYGDEFAFLFKRELADPGSLFDPHWGHLVVLPALLYQVLVETVGLHHYWPYQWLVIAAHLSVAVLLRVLMRRADVHPWLATAAATTFLFLGSGRENLAWGFQVTLTGSIAFGLGALVVLLRRGEGVGDGEVASPARTGDLWVAVLVLCAVACSNVGVTMAAVVGLAAVLAAPDLRSGLRRAATVVAPAALVYVVWSALAPPSEFGVDPSRPGPAIAFGLDVLVAAAEGLVRSPVGAAAVAVVLAAAIAQVVRREDVAAARRLAVPSALLVGAGVSALMVGYARAADVFVVPGTARYVYLVVALLMVPLAVALDELARGHGRVALVLACAAALVGLPGNLALVDPSTPMDETRLGSAAETAHLAELAAGSGLPAAEVITGEVTVGGLAHARGQGWLPEPTDDRDAAGRAALLLALVPGAQPGEGCRPLERGEAVSVREGQTIAFEEAIVVHAVVDGETAGRLAVTTARVGRSALRVRWGPVEIEASSPADAPVQICG